MEIRNEKAPMIPDPITNAPIGTLFFAPSDGNAVNCGISNGGGGVKVGIRVTVGSKT
jgi:hypothetical protein